MSGGNQHFKLKGHILEDDSRRELPHLTLRIAYENPLTATDFAAVLGALAEDYSKLSKGRTLIVGSIDHGSIIAELYDQAVWAAPYIKDAAAIAEATIGVRGLFDAIKDTIRRAKNESVPSRPLPDQHDAFKTIEAVSTAAIDAHATVDVTYKNSPKGTSLSISVTPAEAPNLKRQVRKLKTERRRSARLVADKDQQPPTSLPTGLGILSLDGPVEGDEAKQAVRQLVSSLRETGLLHTAQYLIAELKRSGREAWASLVQAEVVRQQRGRLKGNE